MPSYKFAFIKFFFGFSFNCYQFKLGLSKKALLDKALQVKLFFPVEIMIFDMIINFKFMLVFKKLFHGLIATYSILLRRICRFNFRREENQNSRRSCATFNNGTKRRQRCKSQRTQDAHCIKIWFGDISTSCGHHCSRSSRSQENFSAKTTGETYSDCQRSKNFINMKLIAVWIDFLCKTSF